MSALPRLGPEQASGSDPAAHAWVSASAGAGKTQLLASRVLRLLLAGAAPDRILALTFTKAAAAEMQDRVLRRLMRWAQVDDASIVGDLDALNLPPSLVPMARTRFAAALDARGGLQVQTIHAFAARILAAFPLEAGAPADFRLLDDRTAAEIDRAALDAALADPPPGFLADLAELSIRHGEAGVAEKLAAYGPHAVPLLALGPPSGIEPQLRRALGLPIAGSADEVLAHELARIDAPGVARLAALFDAYGGAKGPANSAALREWLALPQLDRAREFDLLACRFLTDKREPRKAVTLAAMCKADPGAAALADRLKEAVAAAETTRCLLHCAEVAARHRRVAHELARQRERLKSDANALSFDDIIVRAATLLRTAGAADWVRYKLDQRIDHILVDEAQDTNAHQWAIIEALAAEFFAGEGASAARRTLFAVGDYKQSIFGFQGADPAEFQAARQRLCDASVPVTDVPLAINYRSAPAILTFVDRVVTDAGHEAFGLAEPVPAHQPHRTAPGQVTLWPPVTASADEEESDDSERGWVSTTQRAMAAKLAAQIRSWLAAPMPLPARSRAIEPQDILILVRKRREFVSTLVAALGQAGVPVAGADRLDLHAPIAARDVKSLLRFLLQPDDDLSLAELLTSPLLGLSQEDLFTVAHARPATLWSALRDNPAYADTAQWLGQALAIADFTAPSRFLESILSLPAFAARSRTLARLGHDARDVLEEMLNAAHQFEAAHPPSLQGFLAWLEAGEIAVKRDPDAPRAEVRVMTVHGAKGLQAPVVILADAAMESDRDPGHVPFLFEGVELPCHHPGRKYLRGPLGEAAARRSRLTAEEDMRLLYVALTRAEDMLFIGGALKANASEAPANGWWRKAETALLQLGAETLPNGSLCFSSDRQTPSETPQKPAAPAPRPIEIPEWALTPAPAEARPPRPLAPSRLQPDDAPRPPGPLAAARRGRLLHLLFERAPFSIEAARGWLADLAEDEREELISEALSVTDHPAHAALFGPGSLAEAPIAASLPSGFVVAGKVDRLLVTDTHVHLVDFKTGARPPASPHPSHIAQLSAYAQALARIFPAKNLTASLLYTAGPRIFTIDAVTLAAHAANLLLNPADPGASS